MGGAIHNEVAAQLQQICEKAGYHAAVTGLFLVPPLLAGVGTVEMSLAPARAYASLKETYHWQDLGKYELVGPDGVHISADTALFSNIYLIQRRGIDAAEQARLLSTPIADFLVMHVLDEERQIDGTFDALPPHVRHPINSPGTSRLHPERHCVYRVRCAMRQGRTRSKGLSIQRKRRGRTYLGALRGAG